MSYRRLNRYITRPRRFNLYDKKKYEEYNKYELKCEENVYSSTSTRYYLRNKH